MQQSSIQNEGRIERPRPEISPKSTSLYDFASRARRAVAASGQETSENVGGQGAQHLFQDVNTFPENEADDPVTAPAEVIDEKSESFDDLFTWLSELLPGIAWSIICTLTGKPDEPPSDKSIKKMELGWKKFFKAFGLEYVGESMNIKLRSPLWLILMPVTATLAAFAAEFGLVTLFKKAGEQEAKNDENKAA